MGENEKKQSSAGRKTLMIVGILFVSIAVFLGSFVFSFNMIINAANQKKVDDGSIEAENAKLKEDVQILEDKNKILQAEIDRYTGKSSAKATAKPTAKKTSSNDDDEDETGGRSSRSSGNQRDGEDEE